MDIKTVISEFAEQNGQRAVFAKGAALLITPFIPFDRRLSAYYIASNKGYHAMKALLETLRKSGVSAREWEGNVKKLLAGTGAAIQGKNTLCSMDGIGSYFAVHVVECDEIEPQGYVNSQRECGACRACINACPTGAITESGFIKEKCIRFSMDGGEMPETTMRGMTTLLGCELCQRVCPKNARIKPIPLPEPLEAPLSAKSIFEGGKEHKDWLAELVGKNMLSRGRLSAQALVLAANGGDGSWKGEAVKQLEGTPCQRSAGEYYLRRFKG